MVVNCLFLLLILLVLLVTLFLFVLLVTLLLLLALVLLILLVLLIVLATLLALFILLILLATLGIIIALHRIVKLLFHILSSSKTPAPSKSGFNLSRQERGLYSDVKPSVLMNLANRISKRSPASLYGSMASSSWPTVAFFRSVQLTLPLVPGIESSKCSTSLSSSSQ